MSNPYRTAESPPYKIPSMDDLLDKSEPDLIAEWNALQDAFERNATLYATSHDATSVSAGRDALSALRAGMNMLLVVRSYQKQMALLKKIAAFVVEI